MISKDLIGMNKKLFSLVYKHTYVLLSLIVFIGIIFRFYNLGVVPVGFHRDEAFLGYNAYSLLKTLHDLSGNFLPLHFGSFLFSPGGYSYFSIPFIQFFGLSEFSVRFASALFGILTILITFFLTKTLFKKRNFSNELALLSTLFIAISPWHINLSRVATENVIVVFFISLGVWLFLLWRDKKKLLLIILSFFSFAITITIYQSPRAFLPIFIPYLFLITFYSDWKKEIRNIIVSFGLFILLIIIPTLVILTSNDLSQRIQMLSILHHPQTQLVLEEQIREDGVNEVSPFVARAFHNKVISYSNTFMNNYAQHFSYDFIFTDNGLPDRYRVPSMGLLYLFEIPLLLFGIWKILINDKKEGLLILGWILIAPIGSAMTFDDIPNLQRTLLAFPAVSILSAYGFYMLIKKVNINKPYSVAIIILIPIMVFYILLYLHQYYIHQVRHRPWHRQEGAKEMVTKVNELLPDYKKAIITNYESTPGIFFLFYGPYDPELIQKEAKGKSPEYLSEGTFGKYTFTRDGCLLKDLNIKNPDTGKISIMVEGEEDVLYVQRGDCKLPSSNYRKISDIIRSDGTIVYTIIQYIK